MRKCIFARDSFHLPGILNDINNQDTSFLDCKHRHMMKCGAPPDIYRSPCTVCLPIKFHGFTSRISSKGYHYFIPGLNFFRDGMGPLKHLCSSIVYKHN